MQGSSQLSWYPLLVRDMEDLFVGHDRDPDIYALKQERLSVMKHVLEYLLKIQTKNLDEFKNIRTTIDRSALECLVGETREVLLDRFDKNIEDANKKVEIYQKCLKQEESREEISRLVYQSSLQDIADLESKPDLTKEERRKIEHQNFRRLSENILKIEEKYGFGKKT